MSAEGPASLCAEVVAVGTELLLGQIVDTNSAWIGEQLALTGIANYRQTKVGDNRERLAAVLREALERADAVVVCGGLGPTHDDLTREAIADVMGVELVRDEQVAAVIAELFAARGRAMPASNLRQADVPAGAMVIPQRIGSAPGLICPVGPSVLYAVPGVPVEMREMVERSVLPDLVARAGSSRRAIASRVLRTWGESESGLAERLAPRVAALDETPSATLALLASGIEGIKVRITASGASAAEAAAAVDAEEAEVRALIGDLVFGVDDQTMEHAVGDLLIERGEMLAVAESLTGGLLQSRVVEVPGSSKWFAGGLVSYASEVKHRLLDVPDGPVVSEVAARAMARGVARLMRTEVGLAMTGVAGPDRQDGEPPGTVWIGTAVNDDVSAVLLNLPGGRETVRQLSVISALDLLRRRLLGQRPVGPGQR